MRFSIDKKARAHAATPHSSHVHSEVSAPDYPRARSVHNDHGSAHLLSPPARPAQRASRTSASSPTQSPADGRAGRTNAIVRGIRGLRAFPGAALNPCKKSCETLWKTADEPGVTIGGAGVLTAVCRAGSRFAVIRRQTHAPAGTPERRSPRRHPEPGPPVGRLRARRRARR